MCVAVWVCRHAKWKTVNFNKTTKWHWMLINTKLNNFTYERVSLTRCLRRPQQHLSQTRTHTYKLTLYVYNWNKRIAIEDDWIQYDGFFFFDNEAPQTISLVKVICPVVGRDVSRKKSFSSNPINFLDYSPYTIQLRMRDNIMKSITITSWTANLKFKIFLCPNNQRP